MISLGIYPMATGSSAATILAPIPNETTPGPERQTILRIGGTFLSALRRSCQLLQKFSLSDIWPSPARKPIASTYVAREKTPLPVVPTRDAENRGKGFIALQLDVDDPPARAARVVRHYKYRRAG